MFFINMYQKETYDFYNFTNRNNFRKVKRKSDGQRALCKQ